MQRRPLKIERIGGKIFVNKDDTIFSLQSIHTTLAEEFDFFGIACQKKFSAQMWRRLWMKGYQAKDISLYNYELLMQL